MFVGIDRSHKSHNATVQYPIMHHSEQKYGALWYMGQVQCGSCEFGLLDARPSLKDFAIDPYGETRSDSLYLYSIKSFFWKIPRNLICARALMKSQSREIDNLNDGIALEFDRGLGSAVERLVKFQSDRTIMSTNLTDQKLYEIVPSEDVLSDTEAATRLLYKRFSYGLWILSYTIPWISWFRDDARRLLQVWIKSWTLIPAWIRNFMLSKVWDEITYPFLNFNCCTVEV